MSQSAEGGEHGSASNSLPSETDDTSPAEISTGSLLKLNLKSVLIRPRHSAFATESSEQTGSSGVGAPRCKGQPSSYMEIYRIARFEAFHSFNIASHSSISAG